MAEVRTKTAPRERFQLEEKFDTDYKLLNPGQKKAVDTIEGPVMVLAGPGTGKTQTLAMRIANILRQTQMDPWNILCLTFTESGVAAMRQRLLKIIGTPAYYVRIYTFHSFCNEVISQHPEIFALAADWQALTDVERVRLLRRLIDKLPANSSLKPFGSPYLFLKDISGSIKDLKQEDISPEQFKNILAALKEFQDAVGPKLQAFYDLKPSQRTEAQCAAMFNILKEVAAGKKISTSVTAVLDSAWRRYHDALQLAAGKREAGRAATAYKNELKKWHGGIIRNLPKQTDLQKVYQAYQRGLRRSGRYDYEDMITMVVRQWQKNKDLLAEYQEQFQYILVDEFQDTNGAQNEVVSLLSAYDAQPNLFVVGDDKQSIFRFQGASLNNMLEFYFKYRDHLTVISLQENYRSQPEVLAAASALITNNRQSIVRYIPQISDALEAKAKLPAQPLELFEAASEDNEDWLVTSQIKQLLEQGVNPGQIAVLFRYNRDGRELYRLLQAHGVPAQLEGGENILDDITIRQLLSLLNYLNDLQRDDLLAEIIQFEWWQTDPLDAYKAIYFAGRRRLILADVLSDEKYLKAAGIKKIKNISRIATLLAQWRQLLVNTTLQNALHHILESSGWLNFILASGSGLDTLKKLSTFFNFVKELNVRDHNISVRQLLENINLLREHGLSIELEPWHTAAEAVRLMTAHRAKGLEFDHVFLIRLNDRHWGNNSQRNKLSLPQGLVKLDLVIDQENNEDERRLFYTALTRARQKAVLTRALHNSGGRQTVPSIFLQEISAHVTARPTLAFSAETSQLAGPMKPAPHHQLLDLKAWLKGNLENYVMSVTHLNNYLNCPRKFYIKNILQVPAARSPQQALGTAVHAALGKFITDYSQSDRLPGSEHLVYLFRSFLQREILTPTQFKHALAVGTKLLSDYWQQYKADWSRPAISEYSFRSHHVVAAGVPITGQIDKLELVDNRPGAVRAWPKNSPVNVVDYKTGDPVRGLKKTEKNQDYWRQIVFYQILCDASTQFPYKMVSGEVAFIQPDEKRGYLSKKIEVTSGDKKSLIETMQRVQAEIKDLKFLDPSAACGECDVCTGGPY